ncbi:MAG TPA: type II secretion system protein [Patescibacteria group bacterium]|nr:type II secretion system protein [Patescibacteria group bacterium]
MARNKKLVKGLRRGSLLIEMLISISILAILSTAGYIGISSQITKANDAKIKSNLIEIRNAFDQYYDDMKCYPKEFPECGMPLKKGNVTYIQKFPCLDGNKPYGYELISKDPHDSRNKEKNGIVECPSWYKVLVDLQNTNDKNIDFIGCRKGCGKSCNYNFGISSTNMPINDSCPQYSLFACTPSKKCIEYTDPGISECPIIFRDDPTCQNKCDIKANDCKNEAGKKPSG